MGVVFLIICLSLAISRSYGARILGVFPVPSYSHQVVFRSLTQELAKRGHELVIITPDPAFKNGTAPRNIKEIDVHDVSYKLWRESFVKSLDTKSSDIDIVDIGIRIATDVFEEQIKHEQVKKIIADNEHFDLVLVEACVRPALVMGHVFKAPVIQISSFGVILENFDQHDLHYHILLTQHMASKRLYGLTLWEKLSKIYSELRLNYIFNWKQYYYDVGVLKRNFGENTPSFKELYENVAMFFVNVYPIWDDNRKVNGRFVYMGGVHTIPHKPLPKDLQAYLDSSKHGVVYMSFGTNVLPSLIGSDRIRTILNVLGKLPYDVLLKWDKDVLPGKPDNVRIFKWLPQSDLLRHPKVKLYINQAGLQSTDEAIKAEVPMIAFPMLADQWYNAEKYVFHKIGIQLDIKTVTEEIFSNAIDTVIKDPSYKQNIARLHILMEDQPQSPLERAVWWTEHVLRHGGASHLRSPAANISWTEYLMLDVLAFLLSILTAIVFIVYFSIKNIVRLFDKQIKSKKH